MPLSITPFVTTQNSAPGDAFRTAGDRKLGVLPIPCASFPWQAAQYWTYNLAPACSAWASLSVRVF